MFSAHENNATTTNFATVTKDPLRTTEVSHPSEFAPTEFAPTSNQIAISPGHHQNWLYGDVMRNGNMAAKGRQAIQSIFRALFVA